MRFTAYYTEGRVFSGDEADWLKLPSTGVLFVVEHRDSGRGTFSGGDWYWLAEGALHYLSSKEWGTDQPPPLVDCVSCLKRGDGVSDAEFQSVVERALRETA